ncbi:unnamed protein product, partial [Brugia timori]|uniref:Uncharacterized protein n=1 Tax=Brugia timori TaxID=42155 RepID=A0A0R3QL92_9BILA
MLPIVESKIAYYARSAKITEQKLKFGFTFDIRCIKRERLGELLASAGCCSTSNVPELVNSIFYHDFFISSTVNCLSGM